MAQNNSIDPYSLVAFFAFFYIVVSIPRVIRGPAFSVFPSYFLENILFSLFSWIIILWVFGSVIAGSILYILDRQEVVSIPSVYITMNSVIIPMGIIVYSWMLGILMEVLNTTVI